MMSKLSSREKTMLYVLLLFALVAGAIYFVILPTLDSRAQLLEEISALEVQAAEMRMAITAGEGMRDQVTDLEAEVEALEGGLLPALDALTANRLLTGMLESAGLHPVSLTIQPAETVAIPAFASQAVAASQAEAAERAGASQAEAAPLAGRRTADAVARGELVALAALLDAVEATPGLELLTVDYGPPEEAGGVSFYLTFGLYTP